MVQSVPDWVVANPPFYPPGWGRAEQPAPGADTPRAATHALHGDVADFSRAAARLLVPHGQAVFVFDADRLPALLLALDGAGLTCAALRLPPHQVMMVAAHNDDLQAARATGLKTAFVPRPTEYGPDQTTDLTPIADWDHIAPDFTALARAL